MLKPLMDQFVCVRLVRAENLDLSVFDFDPDLSFAVFLMNADKTVYGRFGTRSDFFKSSRDISLEGLQKALRTALQWHKDVARIRASLTAKRPANPQYKTLADFPSVRRRFRGRGGRCTHCHDIRTAQQLAYRSQGKPMPDRVLFSWPMPDATGLNLDPKQMATVKKIWSDSAAERSGFQVGDRIVRLDGQPILSIADVQWVLQNAPDKGTLTAQVFRSDKSMSIKLELEEGWRRYVDISWRTTTGILRQRLLNGIEYRDLKPADRKKRGLEPAVVALRAARGVSRNSNTPVKRDDVIISVDGNSDYMSEGDLMAYLVQKKKAGDKVRLGLLRDGKKVTVEIRAN